MKNDRFPFRFPLSNADIAEIHRRAARERSIAMQHVFAGLGRWLRGLTKRASPADAVPSQRRTA